LPTETRQHLPQYRQAAASGPASVLICDDEARLAKLTAQLLESHGFDTFAATDVAEARKRLAAVAVSAIVLDVNLPGESSYELLEYLQEMGHSARVLLTSGLAEDDVPELLLRHPAVAGYIGKPYSVDSVAERLHELLLDD
jgi:DNA-binding response OmpR family regulator